MSAVETPARKKRGGRPKKVQEGTRQDEGPRIKTGNREEVARLLKDSDLTPAEIAAKVGCAASYVYMVRYAMRKSGELAED
jgi:hypothetical protein